MEVGRICVCILGMGMMLGGLPGHWLLSQSSSRVLARSVRLEFAFSAQESSSTAINLKNRLRFFHYYLSRFLGGFFSFPKFMQ